MTATVSATTREVTRFLSHTVVTQHGLIWTGSVNVVSRYPQFRVGNRVVLGHRWFYESVKRQKIPAGYDVHHRCRMRRCLTCLEAVPAVVNRRDQWRAEKARRLRVASERRIYKGLKFSA